MKKAIILAIVIIVAGCAYIEYTTQSSSASPISTSTIATSASIAQKNSNNSVAEGNDINPDSNSVPTNSTSQITNSSISKQNALSNTFLILQTSPINKFATYKGAQTNIYHLLNNKLSSGFGACSNPTNVYIKNKILAEYNGLKETWYEINYNGDPNLDTGYIHIENPDVFTNYSTTSPSANTINLSTGEIQHKAPQPTASKMQKDPKNILAWVLADNANSNPDTVVIENNTGTAISETLMAQYMTKWCLSAQVNYSMANATTQWAPPFFGPIPASDLMKAFINANGTLALSKNITAKELQNANLELMKLLTKNKPLLSQSEIYAYIETIDPNVKTTDIVDHKDYYSVYTTSNGEKVLYNTVSKYTGTTAC